MKGRQKRTKQSTGFRSKRRSPFSLTPLVEDAGHSESERREIIIGHLARQALMFVNFVEVGDDKIRFISARVATARERKEYEKGEPDVAAVFKSAETVNRLLRSVISAMPETRRRKAP